MADLIPVPEETPVPQIETNTRVLGGKGGPANQQAQALLNRQKLLVDNFADPSNGTKIIGWIRDSVDAVATTLYKWMGWQTPSFFDFMSEAEIEDVKSGAKLLDVSSAVQACINAYQGKTTVFKIRQPAGIYRCDETIKITKPLLVSGDGVSPHLIPNDGSPTGSIFYFNHTGRGIEITPSGASYMGAVLFEKSGTMRPQPDPAPGWEPTDHDFDIYAESSHLELDDFTFVNPTRAIDFFSLGYGRLTMQNIKGQPLRTGIKVTASADVVRVDGVHFWPFWKNNDYIDDYTRNNLDQFHLFRCDNPMFSNIFGIFAKVGIRFSQNEHGCAAKMHLVNADFDRGKHGVVVDETVTTGITAQMDNLTIQGEDGLDGTKNIVIEGSGSIIQAGSIYTSTAEENSIDVSGANNRLSIANFRASQWNLAKAGHAAIKCVVGSIVRLGSVPTMFTVDGGPYFSGPGVIKSPLGDGLSSAATDANGDVLIAHGLGTAPAVVKCQLRSTAALILVPINISKTNFTVRVYVSTTGQVLPKTPVNFSWSAENA